MPNLFPVDYDDEALAVESDFVSDDEVVGYKESVYFDFEKGDYLRDSANRFLTSTGFDAWIQWCIKCLATQRYAHLAYSDDYGVEYEAVFNSTTREEAENELTRQITEALNADPYRRLSYIESMVFDWIDDTAVVVSLVLVGVNGNTAELQTTLKAA